MSELMRQVFEQAHRVCIECGRRFDLFNEEDEQEWHYGHDCEAA